MPKVTYIQVDGASTTLDVKIGESVMVASVQNGLPGIVAECGGSCSCATCHVYIDEPWFDKIGTPEQHELDMLEFVIGQQPNSRLACQVILTEALDGLVVHMPELGNQ